jgi:hypothetical protein
MLGSYLKTLILGVKMRIYSATTVSIIALRITTLSIMALRITTLSIMTLNIIPISIAIRKCYTRHNDARCNDSQCHNSMSQFI